MHFNFVLFCLPLSEKFIQIPRTNIQISLKAPFLRAPRARQRKDGYPHFTGGELRQEKPVVKTRMSTLERQSLQKVP